jgi:hypothetical protein
LWAPCGVWYVAVCYHTCPTSLNEHTIFRFSHCNPRITASTYYCKKYLPVMQDLPESILGLQTCLCRASLFHFLTLIISVLSISTALTHRFLCFQQCCFPGKKYVGIRNIFRKPERKRSHGRTRRRWENNVTYMGYVANN